MCVPLASRCSAISSATPRSAVASLSGVVVAPAYFQPARLGQVRSTPSSPRSATTSHAAILARSLGIPAVVGVGQDVLAVPDGTTIVVDGTEGIVVVDPDPAVTTRYRQRLAAQSRQAEALLLTASRPAVTTDGVTVHVLANIASRDDAVQSVIHGADAVGLLRTEVLFLDLAAARRGRAGRCLSVDRRNAGRPPSHRPHTRRRRRQAPAVPVIAL